MYRPDTPCTALPVIGYYIHADVTFMNGSQIIYSSNFINDTLGCSMGRFSVSYRNSFDVELEPNANYMFIVNFSAIQPPSQTPLPGT